MKKYTLQFADYLVPYEVFIKNLPSQIIKYLKAGSNDLKFIYLSNKKRWKH